MHTIFQADNNSCRIGNAPIGQRGEYDEFQHLGSVVTNNGYSDWAATEIPADVKTMWYRLSRREDDYCIECSEDLGHCFFLKSI